MNDKVEAAFERVYRTTIGELVKLRFAELQNLQQQIIEELRRARMAKCWIEGAIRKKRQDAINNNDNGRQQS
jgi:hypothetical protein